MKLSTRKNDIVKIIAEKQDISITSVAKALKSDVSIPTLNRDLADLVKNKILLRIGNGRNTVYRLVKPDVLYTRKIDDSYFDKEIDERTGNKQFPVTVFKQLKEVELLSSKEMAKLESLHKVYIKKIKTISPTIFKKETERLSIELSWKSSQIEGNTYSLLETELLLKDNIYAKGKEKSEAIMLLNHKLILDLIFQKKVTVFPLTVSAIENIHSVLIKNLGVNRNLRKRPVGITGTTYAPPDNEHQIREYLEKTCKLINSKKNVFEKVILAVLLISFIQPFEDGNKRTARITANAMLIAKGFCPLSYRSVSAMDYKKAMILFYEQNNVYAYKNLFMEQYEFAIKNYF